MNLGLKNKIALVTGASTGIGKAIAQSLSNEGCKVIICSRNKERIQQTAQEINAESFVADVSKREDIEKLYNHVIEKYGKIHVLVNNTGGPPPGSLNDIDDELWMSNFQNTVMSVVRLTKLVLPIMQKQKYGRIINITSTSVKQPIPNLLLSNSLRPCVIGFSKTVSDDVAKHNITINNICPGTIDTVHLRNLSESWGKSLGITKQEMINKLEQNAPINRLGKVEEISSVVAFLASEQASFITGTTIQVDGGRIRSIF